MPYGSRCVECNALLQPPAPVITTTGAQWNSPEYLERGAQLVRDIVAEKKRKRDG